MELDSAVNSASNAPHSSAPADPSSAPVPSSSVSAPADSSDPAPAPAASRASDDRHRRSSRSRSPRSRSRSHSRSRHHRSHRGRSRRSRSRSRSRSPRRHRRDRDRRRHRSRSGSRSRSRSRSAHSRSRSPSKRGTSHSPSRSSDRSAYTIFVSQIHPRIRERELFDFFSAVGRVEDIRLIRDSKTGKSRGLAYVEFSSTSSVPLALPLNGKMLEGFPITVAAVAAAANPADPNAAGGASAAGSATALRVYFGNVNFSATEAELRPLFERFGRVEGLELHRDKETRISRGFGFVTFSNREEGMRAMRELDGFLIGGRPIKVGLGTRSGDQGEIDPNSVSAPASGQLRTVNSRGVPVIYWSAASISVQVAAAVQDPSQVLEIANLVISQDETELDWESELRSEIIDECSQYGQVSFCLIDQRRNLIYVEFSTIESSLRCYTLFHGRWYFERQLLCRFVKKEQFQEIKEKVFQEQAVDNATVASNGTAGANGTASAVDGVGVASAPVLAQ